MRRGEMKGIVFTLLQEIVTAEYGEDTWDELIDASGVEGVYTAVATYPDEDMNALVEAASAKLGVSGDDVLKWFGQRCIPLFAERYPHVFEPHDNARSLALALNDVIHPEVRKMLPGAYVPEFEYDASQPDALTISYSSKRRLCSFAEGLILGVCDHFGETCDVKHTKCMKVGDERCVIDCHFSKAA
jgi:hypothetical protein